MLAKLRSEVRSEVLEYSVLNTPSLSKETLMVNKLSPRLALLVTPQFIRFVLVAMALLVALVAPQAAYAEGVGGHNGG